MIVKNMQNSMSYKLPVVYLKEGKSIIAYCPIIDLSSQGNTIEEAKKNFHEAAELWLEGCIEMGTLDTVLRNFGWKIIRSKKNKQYIPPVLLQSRQEEVCVAA